MFQLLISVYSQQQDFQFEKLTEKSGRSIGFITGIEQDNYGFMWFSTRNGLYRYDGYNYKIFRHKQNDSTSIPFNDITYLYKDKSGMLWLRHYDKIFLFDKDKLSDKFKEITSKQFKLDTKIVEDNYGNFWIGPTEKGLMKYSKKSGKIEYFNYSASIYCPELYFMITKEISNADFLTGLRNIPIYKDTSITFIIKTKQKVLVSSTCEIDKNELFDFGKISSLNKIIWKSTTDSKYAGGNNKNRIQFEVITLNPGKYTLSYTSDNSHAYDEWDANLPEIINTYGIQLFSVSEQLALKLTQLIETNYISKNQLSTSNFNDMLIDKSGNLCLLNEFGIECYLPDKNEFRLTSINYSGILNSDFDKDQLTFYQDRKLNFWIGSSQGLIKFNKENKNYEVFRNTEKNKNILTSNLILSIFEDKFQNLWVGTDNGINLKVKNSLTFQFIKSSNNNNLYDNRIFKIYEDNSGNNWIATYEGLNRMKKSKFKFNDLYIEKYGSFPIILDQQNILWYPGNENSIIRLDRNTNSKKEYQLNKELFGLNYYNEREFIIYDMVDENNFILLTIDNSLHILNKNTGKIDQSAKIKGLVLGKDSVKNKATQIIIDRNKKIWVLALNGIYYYNAIRNNFDEFYSFNQPITDLFDIDRDFVKNTFIDHLNIFWIRTSIGIFSFNPYSKILKMEFDFRKNSISSSLADGNIIQDSQNNIWFAALPILVKINKGIIEKYELANCGDVGMCNVVADSNIIWIYSNNGLFKFDVITEEFKSYTYNDGLVDNNINGLIIDKHQKVWITSLKGLSVFNKKDESFINYFRSFDFISYNFRDKPKKITFSPLGELMFFTPNGYLTYHPDSINWKKPKIIITRLELNGKEFKTDSTLAEKKSLLLKYNQNFLNFEFSALDYTDPDKNKYRYIMEGLDEEWKIVDATNRIASYTSIPPGRYNFIIQASNNDDIWNNEGVVLHITITPPWYKTKFAYFIYIISIFIGFYLFTKWRERTLIKEKNILEEKVVERTTTIVQQNKEITEQRDKIAEQNKNIKDSINYARRIQTAILPPDNQIKEVFPNHFVLYKPRDIVSGDFYWMFLKENLSVIVAADCTGHGVPGAFMSMLGVASLTEIVGKMHQLNANEVLNQLRSQIIRLMRQETIDHIETKDGMDIALCVIDHKKQILQYSGAYNPLYMIRNNELTEMKADRMPIGIFEKSKPFNNTEISLQKGDQFYIFSDGYVDQFGGENLEKFKSKRLKEFLLSIHQKPMSEQKELLDKRIKDWMGNNEQIDDILILGFKIE